jgi:hypothetical protein
MSITRCSSVTALCAASALLGGGLALTTEAVASSHPAAARAATHYLGGGYLLADGKCPKHTVGVNASVKAQTNAPSGHSSFTLCYIKK